jgi:hypothetical protein
VYWRPLRAVNVSCENLLGGLLLVSYGDTPLRLSHLLAVLVWLSGAVFVWGAPPVPCIMSTTVLTFRASILTFQTCHDMTCRRILEYETRGDKNPTKPTTYAGIKHH